MIKRTPKISDTASPQAQAIHNFVVRRGIAIRPWAESAGLSHNILMTLFSGKSRSLTHENMEKLAASIGMTGSDILREGGFGEPLEPSETVRAEDVEAAIRSWAAESRVINIDAAVSGVMGRLAAICKAQKIR